MIGRKVRVFWPLDEQWYVGIVQRFDPSTGEHLLKYPDGDTEWVKIGENGQPSGGNTSNSTTERGGDGGQGGGGQRYYEDQPSSSRFARSSSSKAGEHSSPERRSSSYERKGGKGGASSSDRPGSPGSGRGNAAPYHNMGYPPPHMSYGPPPGMHPHYGGPYPATGGYPPYYPPPPHMHMMPGHMPPSKHNSTEAPSPNPSTQGSSTTGNKRKSGPKTWTKDEDAILLGMVQNMRMPMKWSIVAQSMPERTGKQCRERYVNHLNPRLKSTDWSPVEDATIFHLYNTGGSQWAKMSKMIPGRTDNGIKNRFHNLRRQLEREDEHRVRLSKPSDFPDEIRLDRLREFPEHLKGKNDELWEMSEGIGVLAAQSVLGGSFARNSGRFGPFKVADDKGEQCARCGFFAPSVQTGAELCTRTKWCQACTRIPPHMSSNLLRECVNLRRFQDKSRLHDAEGVDVKIQVKEDVDPMESTKIEINGDGGGNIMVRTDDDDDSTAKFQVKDNISEV